MLTTHTFFFRDNEVALKDGDFAVYNLGTRTLALTRGSERLYTESGDDKIYIEPEYGDDVPAIIETVTGLTPIMREENESRMIFELMSSKKTH